MGKQIKIFLADGSSAGVRHCEITNWTGQALACPRSRIQELKDWPEVKRPGVYFLFGANENTGEDSVYIGEAENVLDRLTSHISGKDFWKELITFTSKDENLTKAHIKYLEARLIEMAQRSGRYQLENSANPQLPTLPRGDRDAMEEYLESAKTVLGVLGHRLLEPLIRPSVAQKIEQRPIDFSTLAKPDIETEGSNGGSEQPISNVKLWLNTSGIKASAVVTDEGFVVLSGSKVATSVQKSLQTSQSLLRDKLIKSGVIVTHGDGMVFQRDQLFNSPSLAAAVIVGYSINGRTNWTLENGTTLKEYEDRISSQYKS